MDASRTADHYECKPHAWYRELLSGPVLAGEGRSRGPTPIPTSCGLQAHNLKVVGSNPAPRTRAEARTSSAIMSMTPGPRLIAPGAENLVKKEVVNRVSDAVLEVPIMLPADSAMAFDVAAARSPCSTAAVLRHVPLLRQKPRVGAKSSVTMRLPLWPSRSTSPRLS